MMWKQGSPSTRHPSHCPDLSTVSVPRVPVTLLCLWRAAPFLINFPLDPNFGACVEFFLHFLPRTLFPQCRAWSPLPGDIWPVLLL